MKKRFLTGLAIILPIVLTFLIVNFFLKLLTGPFLSATQYFLSSFGAKNGWFYLFQTPEATKLISELLILVLLVILITFVGFLARLIFINTLFKWSDRLLHSIPLANKVYKAAQDVLQNIFSEEKPTFSKAVLFPFPHLRAKAIGFITNEHKIAHDYASENDLVSVFVPGTPNPMMGFMLLVPKGKILPLDLSLEEAIKFVVSCGVIYKRKSS